MSQSLERRHEIMEVTPAQAQLWFDNRARNRPFSKAVATTYRGIMERGHWHLNGEALIFDTAGRLIDGQHRLQAVVWYGKPMSFLCVFGVPITAMPSINSGKSRTLHHRTVIGALDLPIEKEHSYVAKALFGSRRGDAEDLISFCAKHFKAIDFSIRHTAPPIVGISVASVQAAIVRAFAYVPEDRLSRFCEILMGAIPAEGTEEETPYTLRKDLLENRTHRSDARKRRLAFTKTLRAIEAFKDGEILKIIRGLKTDIFPLLEREENV